ncbi:MAG: hypothetical protein QG673_1770 [Pseudomonadota bacterium]|nr:hypothetical protein [Pseudomonadota bacterium]
MVNIERDFLCYDFITEYSSGFIMFTNCILDTCFNYIGSIQMLVNRLFRVNPSAGRINPKVETVNKIIKLMDANKDAAIKVVAYLVNYRYERSCNSIDKAGGINALNAILNDSSITGSHGLTGNELIELASNTLGKVAIPATLTKLLQGKDGNGQQLNSTQIDIVKTAIVSVALRGGNVVEKFLIENNLLTLDDFRHNNNLRNDDVVVALNKSDANPSSVIYNEQTEKWVSDIKTDINQLEKRLIRHQKSELDQYFINTNNYGEFIGDCGRSKLKLVRHIENVDTRKLFYSSYRDLFKAGIDSFGVPKKDVQTGSLNQHAVISLIRAIVLYAQCYILAELTYYNVQDSGQDCTNIEGQELATLSSPDNCFRITVSKTQLSAGIAKIFNDFLRVERRCDEKINQQYFCSLIREQLNNWLCASEKENVQLNEIISGAIEEINK